MKFTTDFPVTVRQRITYPDGSVTEKLEKVPFARLSDINDEPEREFGAELEAILRKHFGVMQSPSKVQAAIVDIEELRRKHGK